MVYALAVLLLLAGQSLPVPTPSPTPLKEIAHTRSTAFCEVMRENVGVAIAGLLVNDQVIAQAKPALLALGSEFVDNHGRSGYAEFDRIRLERIAGSLAKNLGVIGEVLGSSRFVRNPQTADDQVLAEMKTRLQAVADQQNAELNLISGIAETYALEDLNSRPSGLNGAVEKQLDINPGGNGANSGMFNQTVVQFQNDPTHPGFDPRFNVTASDLANNPFGHLFAAMTFGQIQTQRLESTAAAAILPSVPSCH